jgi:hypothetical protein
LFRKGFSVATIGIFLVSILAIFNPAAAVVPAPANYQLAEYAWLKEDGVAPETWAMYNNTGWNRLNLSFKFSKCNIAYVARSAATSDDFNVTFCVIYNDTTTGFGFNTTGHLLPGTQANGYWNRTVPAVSTQTAGVYTYHLFITTFDPMGVAGMYEVRINETAPGVVGSSWTDPAGTVVEWMFFFVPTATPDVLVRDQLGRLSPFYLDGDSPTTQYNATMVIQPPGNDTGATTATFEWLDPEGSSIWTKSGIPIYYVPGEGWATQWVIAANTSFTPFNATHPYGVRITMGAFVQGAAFFVLSTQWINVDITVEPTMDQWFDPSSFLVTFTAIINTGVTANPYQEVHNLTLQFWDKVHYDLLPTADPDGVPEWYGGLPIDPAGNPVFANLSWNITGYPVVDGSSYTYTYTKMIPASYIDNSTTGLVEFFGWYGIRSHDGVGTFPAVIAREDFWVDDPIEGATSLAEASTVTQTIWEQKPGTVWVNVEYDPTYFRSRMHDSDEFADKNTNITWYYNDYWDVAMIKPPGNDMKVMTQDAMWPSDQYWASSTASVNSSFIIQGYDIVANATCDTGYVVRELIEWNVVYRVLYLEIWPKWESYYPCMKKSIVGKTYYLDEDENEVPVPWGFMVTKLIDPNGIPYLDMVSGPEEWNPFAWTVTRLNPDETEALGAVWDEIPSDAEEGTWTVHAMALGSEDWESTSTQTVSIGGTAYSFAGPSVTTFEVMGTDVHLMIDGIVDEMDDNFNLTWEVLADILANQDDIMADIAALGDEQLEKIINLLEGEDGVLEMLIEQGASIDSINDYVREIRALTQRIDRWRTDLAEDMVDHLGQILAAVSGVNDQVNGMWNDVSSQLQIGFYGLSPHDPRSMTKKIDEARAAVVDAVVTSLAQIVSKVDTVEESLGDKVVNVLNAVNTETGLLDDSIKAALTANVNYIVSNIRAKIDDSEVALSSKISSAADGLHGKFAGVISEIGHVANKVDAVEAKLGGVESNVGDKVDAVDASVGTKLLVAIILIVIVLILVLLPIVAPGFRMKE